MADQPEGDDVLDLRDEAPDADPPESQGDDPSDDDGDKGGDGGDDEGELVVSFDDDDPEADRPDDSSTIRRMREELRQTKARLREVEQQAAPTAVDVGEKPTLESCDYDEDRFEEALEAWKDRKRQADERQARAAAEREEANKEWESAKERYHAQRVKHGFGDMTEEEATIGEALGVNSPVVLVAANDPALMFKALAASPAKLAELKTIKNPFALAAAIARMEGAVKVTKRNAPKPDTPVRGSGALPGGTDKTLERLEREAARTGDRTALIKYKASLKKAGK